MAIAPRTSSSVQPLPVQTVEELIHRSPARGMATSPPYDGGANVGQQQRDSKRSGAAWCCLHSGYNLPVGTRNLLDFNDLTTDKQGRVVAALCGRLRDC